jgi:Lar family restriction alleviation protein
MTVTPTELESCPFCGGPAALSEVDAASHKWQAVYVFCNGDCGARGETFDIHMDDTEDPPEQIRGWAIAAWNRRAPPPSADAEGLRATNEMVEAFCAELDKQDIGQSHPIYPVPIINAILALAAQSPPEPGWNEAIEASAEWHEDRADELDAAAIETLSVANKVNLDTAARGHRIYAESIRSLKKPEATQP